MAYLAGPAGISRLEVSVGIFRYPQAFSNLRRYFRASEGVGYSYIKYSLMRRDMQEAWLTNLMLDFISAGYLQAGLAACEP